MYTTNEIAGQGLIVIQHSYYVDIGAVRCGVFEYKTGVGAFNRATALYAGHIHGQVPLPMWICVILIIVGLASLRTLLKGRVRTLPNERVRP